MNEQADKEIVVRDTLSSMSHELRTPLTSIIGFTELMLDDDEIKGEAREYLNIIAEETERLRGSLQHYLSVLKIEQERKDKEQAADGQA